MVDGAKKRVFLAIGPLIANLIGLWAVYTALRTGLADGWPYLGVALANLSFLVFLVFVYAGKPPRTGVHLPGLLIMVLAGLGLAAAGVAVGRADALVPALAAFGAANHFIYLYWYSYFGRTPSPQLRVGARFPDVAFETTDGERVSTASLGGAPAILLFYRGNWCPLCTAQIRELAAQYREIAARGARVVLISPQPHAQSRELAARVDAPMDFWVDPGCRGARVLGIGQLSGVPWGLRGYEADTVLPTVVILDPEGAIVWADETDHYRLRPEPATFLAVLDGLAPA